MDKNNPDDIEILQITMNLDLQPPEVQALGILALSGQHLAGISILQGRMAQLMDSGHVLPINSTELRALLVQFAFQIAKLGDFNSFDGCDILQEAQNARHSLEQGVAELQAHKTSGRQLN